MVTLSFCVYTIGIILSQEKKNTQEVQRKEGRMAVEDTLPLWRRVTERIEGDPTLCEQVLKGLSRGNERPLRLAARTILLSYRGTTTPALVSQLAEVVKTQKGW